MLLKNLDLKAKELMVSIKRLTLKVMANFF